MVLFVLAIWGAALSTFNWRQAVKRDRRRVRVKLSTAMPTYGADVGAPYAQIEATNIGHRPVTVTRLTFRLPDDSTFAKFSSEGIPGIMPDTQLPAALSDGQTARVAIAYFDIAGALIRSGRTKKTKITPVCEDSAGGVYEGKSWKVDVEELLKMGRP